MAVIYFNHAGTSWPKPEPVRAAVSEALSVSPLAWGQQLEDHHRTVASHFGVSEPAQLLLTPGATSAIAAALASAPWRSGDRVLVSGFEHEALYGPARRLSGLGVEVEVVGPTSTAPVDLGAVEASLRRGGVRMLAMSAASNVTGALLPIMELAGLARRHGAVSLIDAAQLAGWTELDLPALGADFVAIAGHKGPQAPWGIGGLYVSPRLPWAAPGYCDVGSVDRAGLAGLAAGLAWLEQRPQRLARARALIQALASALAALPGVRLLGPASAEARVPTLAMTVEGRPATQLAQQLAARGVVSSGGRQCAPLAHATLGTAEHGVLRLSLGPSSTQAEVEQAAQLFAELLEDPRER